VIRKSIFTLAVCLWALSADLQAAVQAGLDRHRIIEGETVTLTIRTDDPSQRLETDLTVLEADFEILDQRSETQLSIVNGQQTAVVRLLVTLEPRRTGELEIPALVFGQEQTGPIAVQVEPAPEPAPGTPPPVFIEVETVPETGPYYVHAQFSLVVRIFYQQNLTEAAISQPEPALASVRLMQETPYQAERNGVRYRVLERVYALFPERSGLLEVPPLKLSGRLVERRAGTVWNLASRGRRVQVQSEALRLDIAPKPQDYEGENWQPARDYRLTQLVSAGEAVRVGEPVTRTVIVDAVGLEENMIVEPVWPELPDVRIYPDQPQGITRDDGRWVLGHKEFRYAVVPEQTGELVLPPLQVEWWDTRNDRLQTALLDAHTVYVQPAALVPPPAPEVAGSLELDSLSAPPSDAAGSSLWRFLASLFAFLWLATLLFAWSLHSRMRGARQAAASNAAMNEAERALLADLKKACDASDARQARAVLRRWLGRFGPVAGRGSLLDFAEESRDRQLRDAIYTMDSMGFRPGSDASWDGRAFWQQFDHWHREQRKTNRARRPPPTDLYAPENRPAS